MQEKLTVIDSKHVGRQLSTLLTKNAVNTMIHFVGCVTLDIWRVEQYVCFWPLWFSKPTISFTVTTFSSVRVCFSLPVSCLWSVLHVSQISVSTLSLLQFIFKNSASILQRLYFFEPVQVLNQRFTVSAAKVNGTLHQRYIVSALKIIIYDNIICFCLQTSVMHEKLNKI